MRRLYLRHRRGHGFDLYEEDGAAVTVLSRGLGVATLAPFLAEAARELGEWAGKEAGKAAGPQGLFNLIQPVGRALLALRKRTA